MDRRQRRRRREIAVVQMIVLAHRMGVAHLVSERHTFDIDEKVEEDGEDHGGGVGVGNVSKTYTSFETALFP